MDKDLRDWVSEQVLQGSEPLDITAAVAREITKSKGLPITVITITSRFGFSGSS